MERNKMMVRKLNELIVDGTIENQWEETFIMNVSVTVKSGRALTSSQQAKLDELFDRY